MTFFSFMSVWFFFCSLFSSVCSFRLFPPPSETWSIQVNKNMSFLPSCLGTGQFARHLRHENGSSADWLRVHVQDRSSHPSEMPLGQTFFTCHSLSAQSPPELLTISPPELCLSWVFLLYLKPWIWQLPSSINPPCRGRTVAPVLIYSLPPFYF